MMVSSERPNGAVMAGGPGTARIVDAPPHMAVADEFMEHMMAPDECCLPYATFTDGDPAVLTFTDDYGGRFVYVVVDYHVDEQVWHIAWPD